MSSRMRFAKPELTSRPTMITSQRTQGMKNGFMKLETEDGWLSLKTGEFDIALPPSPPS